MLNFAGWIPELVATQALEGKGIPELWAAIEAHDRYLNETGAIVGKRRTAFAHRVRQLALGTLERRVEEAIGALPESLDPYVAAERVVEGFGVGDGLAALGNARARGDVRATVRGL
jgi:LAO/AO transport system kinase